MPLAESRIQPASVALKYNFISSPKQTETKRTVLLPVGRLTIIHQTIFHPLQPARVTEYI